MIDHEDWHFETMMYIRHTLGYTYPQARAFFSGSYSWQLAATPTALSADRHWES